MMLSFCGWMILGMLSFGLGYIWVVPYMNATFTNFYLNLNGETPACAAK